MIDLVACGASLEAREFAFDYVCSDLTEDQKEEYGYDNASNLWNAILVALDEIGRYEGEEVLEDIVQGLNSRSMERFARDRRLIA